MIDIERKLKRIISKSDFEQMQNIAIYQKTDGTYVLFNKYNVTKTSDNETIVKLNNGDIVHSFGTMKNAVSWCILDNRGAYMKASRIINLDSRISSSDIIIYMNHRLFSKATNDDIKLIHLAKMNEERDKKRKMVLELNQYLVESHRLQQKRFNLKPSH